MKHTRGRAIRMAARAGASHRGARANAMLSSKPAPLTRATPARSLPTRRARERDGEKAVGRARLPLGFGGWERVERAVVRRQGDAGR